MKLLFLILKKQINRGVLKIKTLEYTKRKYNKKHNRKKSKKPTIHVNNRDYYIWAMLFIPFIELYRFIDDKTWQEMEWNEAKANKILDYVVPYIFDYNKSDDRFNVLIDKYSVTNYSVANHILRKSPFRYRRWVRKFKYNILDYLENSYEYDGYDKTIEEYYGYKYVVFRKTEV